jgi:hypothetical protein
MQDYEEGLNRAYSSPDGLYRDGDHLYVAGTRNFGHFLEWYKIPFQQVQNSSIYQNMDNYLKDNPGINTLVGHSYGSSAFLEKQKQDNRYKTIAYNSPVFDNIFKNHNKITQTNRYANAFDPVAMFDFSSKRSFTPTSLNVNSYTNAGRNKEINDDVSKLGFVSNRLKPYM